MWTQAVLTKLAMSAFGIALAVWVALSVSHGFTEAVRHTIALFPH